MRSRQRRVVGTVFSPLRRGVDRWRSSMMLRVVTSSIVIGFVSVAILGAYVSTQIRDGLVDTKLERILAESSRDVASAQAQVYSSTAVTQGELEQFEYKLVTDMRQLGGEDREVLLLQREGNQGGVVLPELASDLELLATVTPEMRRGLSEGAQQSWQHVAFPETGEPGVVVGAPLDVPVAGDFELYFVYSLGDEQRTLGVIQRILGLGGLALVALVVFMTWSVTLQAVRPVRQAARVAARLAEGHLDARMGVRGRDEMATLASTFNDMAESLQRQITKMEELSRVQRRFVSDVSHELRTPLTTIRMASEVLHEARFAFTPEAARSAELLSTQLDRFEVLLADLLEISRIDAGVSQLDFEETDLLGVVRDEAETVAPVAKQGGVALRLWAAEGSHVASMDRTRVGRIVRNLLSNAVEYAQARPVDILVGSNRRGVAVVVRDYGLGMTAQQAERVFDRFWRADSSRRRTMGGTGLGLAIAREDAHLHGGRLEAWGSPRMGASFRLTLPRSSEGLGTRPVLPLVPHEEDFPAHGVRVPLSKGSSRRKR
ncbi:MAG: HAMP domain-containing histidine kinase [Demequinaceae bacterium]|nr:HAMP domain-containing histidine kinase [Demequinaceae bacterium]